VKLVVVLFALGCGHIPKADPATAPPPWPPTPAPVKSETPPPLEEKAPEKPLEPPLKTLPPSRS
jgi:hypothetical protein